MAKEGKKVKVGFIASIIFLVLIKKLRLLMQNIIFTDFSLMKLENQLSTVFRMIKIYTPNYKLLKLFKNN